MKKTLTIILAFATLICSAGEPDFSMYLKPVKKETKESKLLNGNNAGAWAAVGGFALFAGSAVKMFVSMQEIPDAANFSNFDDYKKQLDKYNDNVKNSNTIFYGALGVSGFCLIVSGLELANRPVVVTDKVVLKIKSSPNTVGLCLNFK